MSTKLNSPNSLYVHSFHQLVPNFIEFLLVVPEMKHKDAVFRYTSITLYEVG